MQREAVEKKIRAYDGVKIFQGDEGDTSTAKVIDARLCNKYKRSHRRRTWELKLKWDDKFQYGTEEDSWFFECDVRKNIVRDQDPGGEDSTDVASFRCYVSRPLPPRDPYEQTILAVEMTRISQDQQAILSSANK